MQIFSSSIDEDNEDGNNFFWQRTKKRERTCYTKIPEGAGKVIEKEEILRKAFVGKLPVMVMSDKCHFSSLGREDVIRKGHCHFDKGGYFIINGSEKVCLLKNLL